jgi:hypothetical protein
MINTVPSTITRELLAFCKSLSNAYPRFIRSVPAAQARPSACFDNVAHQVARSGGEIAYGWAIWHLSKAYYEAEHHAVWQAPAGELVDVSPHPNGANEILFLLDQRAVYDPLRPRMNILMAVRGNAIAAEFVNLADERNRIFQKYRDGGARIAILRPDDRARVSQLDVTLSALLARLNSLAQQ